MRLLLLVLTLSLSTTVLAQRLVGQAEFSVLWFDIYDARLFHPSGQFDFSAIEQTRLELVYKRDIDKDDLIDKTREQWQELGLELSPQREQWLQQLNQLWPNLKRGDSLAFTVTKQGQGMFELSQKGAPYKPLPTMMTEEFSRDFLAIWLQPRGKLTGFQRQLLGRSK